VLSAVEDLLEGDGDAEVQMATMVVQRCQARCAVGVVSDSRRDTWGSLCSCGATTLSVVDDVVVVHALG
jgi:hypothetical protein